MRVGTNGFFELQNMNLVLKFRNSDQRYKILKNSINSWIFIINKEVSESKNMNLGSKLKNSIKRLTFSNVHYIFRFP